jgi:phage terminase large subunit-like protein
MAINKKALDAAIRGTTAERVYLCGKDFSLFFCYYFSEYIKYPFAPFHFDFFDDVKGMMSGKYREVAWIGFRECAKTSFAKIFLTWLIVYKKKLYINVDSYSTTNAERILFDVILNLQTNKLIVSDFGHLYNAKRDENETTQKRVNNFVTNNGVRVEAHSTGKSVRGRLHGNQRPDFLLLDDFETNDTKDSKLTTDSIIGHIDEFKSGLDSSANVLYLGNFITEHGSVATLYERAKIDHRLMVRQIDAEKDGRPTWDTKYTMTDEEADAKNEGLTENKFVSLEDKKRQLGSLVYSAEMMNTPVSEKSGIFKKEMFKYISRSDLEKKNTRKFATIDSALSKNADSDATGVVRNYVDEQNFWHVSGKEYRINPKGLIDLIFQLYDENMEVIGVETTAFTQAIQPFFEDECRKRGKYPHIVQLKHGGIMKETRIQALVPYYETKTIVHIEGECSEMEQQLFKFPMGKHDDICFSKDTKIEGDIIMQKSTGIHNVYDFMGSKVTHNHPYLTQRGFVSLDSLQYCDRIVVWKNKSLMELSLDDTQTLRGLHIKTTLYLLHRSLQALNAHCSIGMYGQNIMEKYPKAFKFIIKTVIHLITIYIISNLYQEKNTISIMPICQKMLKGLVEMPSRIIKRCKKLLKFGETVKKEKNGTQITQEQLLTDLYRLHALDAEPWRPDSQQHQNTVQQNAKENIKLENGGKNTRNIINDLDCLGKEEVFATKTSNGWFTANGVVVSNCDALQYQRFVAKSAARLNKPTTSRQTYVYNPRMY